MSGVVVFFSAGHFLILDQSQFKLCLYIALQVVNHQGSKIIVVATELGPEDCVLLEGVVSHSFFVLPTMLPVWRSALEAFTGGRYLYAFTHSNHIPVIDDPS